MLFSKRPVFRLMGAALIGGTMFMSPAGAQTDTPSDLLFVLDSSNSMWGQIDGTAKAEIARSAFEGFVAGLPDGTRAGVMAYGHRRKADCGDVETLVPVSELDRSKLVQSVKALTPRGKTPITETLRQAAELLAQNDRPGRLILISDGIETCGGDPCALAEALAKSGVDFKAHVIGFDIASKADQAKIACIAHLTGGTYWNAKDADGLTEALKESVAAVEEKAPLPVTVLTAADKESGQPVSGPVQWTVATVDDETVVASGMTGGSVEVELEPGSYVVSAELGEKAGGASLEVSDKGGQQTVLLDGNLPEARVTPASPEAPATSLLEVAFEGPGLDGDFLRVVTPDGNRLERDLWVYVRDGNPAKLALPTQPGDYEIVYVWADSGERVLAKAPIKVTEVQAILTYAPEVAAGQPVEIAFEGPNGPEDWIGIVPKDGTVDDYQGRWKGTADGSPVTLQAPSEAGTYDVIYVTGIDQTILTRQPLTVGESAATLQADSTVEAAGRLNVTWSGPKAPDDWIGIAPVGSDPSAYVTYERPDGDSVSIIAPLARGDYELRYILSTSDGSKILASQPLKITDPKVTLEGPSEVPAASYVSVKASGPANSSNFIGFAEPSQDAWSTAPGAWEIADNISNGVVEVRTPEEPGTYELRFVLSAGDAEIVARQTVTVK
ncbi:MULTISPECIES: VWA domain-containing protein [unclassified Labrenzia]|uniref:vWA domain-containing protein n=1 Tax=unclassified Labrenzia TaxID=2648686 RepID=UPI0004B1EE8A|nr:MULTISPECIES: VWA domain-containing protein [unclassified Labrenzia]